eukprot:5817167-Prymnesium_polylepis.1
MGGKKAKRRSSQQGSVAQMDNNNPLPRRLQWLEPYLKELRDGCSTTLQLKWNSNRVVGAKASKALAAIRAE